MVSKLVRRKRSVLALLMGLTVAGSALATVYDREATLPSAVVEHREDGPLTRALGHAADTPARTYRAVLNGVPLEYEATRSADPLPRLFGELEQTLTAAHESGIVMGVSVPESALSTVLAVRRASGSIAPFALVNAEGDVPGGDPVGVPRPRDSQRRLSFSLQHEGSDFSLHVYRLIGTHLLPPDYLAALEAAGWQSAAMGHATSGNIPRGQGYGFTQGRRRLEVWVRDTPKGIRVAVMTHTDAGG